MQDGLENYIFTDHAREEMARRGIEEAMVASILQTPGQRFNVRSGRDVFQAIARQWGIADNVCRQNICRC